MTGVFRLTVAIWALAFLSFAMVIAAGDALSYQMLLWLFFTALAGAGLSIMVFMAFRRLARLPTMPRRAFLFVLVACAAVLEALIDGVLLGALNPSAAPHTWADPSTVALNAVIYFWLFGLYVSILELMALKSAALAQAQLVRDYERRLSSARDLAREAKVSLLRFQFEPDFIFNVLNNISSLVVTGDVDGAERAIARLCRFLRAAMQTGEGEMAPLAHELATIEAYLDIEATRFSERPKVSVQCPSDLHAVLVPTLILQPIIEQMVARARAATAGTFWIDIVVQSAAEAVRITVATAAADDPPGASAAIGFDAVRARLQTLYGDKSLLRTYVDNDVFTATLSLSRDASLVGAFA